MKMKMKLLDYTLISLLAAMTPLAIAQETAAAAADAGEGAVPAPEVDCTEAGCSSQEGMLFRLRTHGERQPVVEAGDNASSETLQPDRRVTVALEPPGKAVATGKFSLSLPNGGVIWATEDPAMGEAELSVSAPGIVPFDGKAITKPVQFYVRSNYSAFVQRYELSIYRSADSDLIEPLVTMPLKVGNVGSTEWDGVLPAQYRFRVGDELVYVLRAFDAQGNFDETHANQLQLVSPEEAERGGESLRDSAEESVGTSLTTEEAQTQSLIEEAFSENGLRQQNIPFYGSRIRIQGRNLPGGYGLKINGENYPVDLERKFTAEYLMPVGEHAFQIELDGGRGDGYGGKPAAPGMALHHTLNVEVTGKYFFGVGLADVTFSQNKISGSVDPFTVDSRYADDVISDGRLAFYGKAKFKGKYLVTAQADTTEQDLKRLFSGFTSEDAQDIFRNLDSDLYYPTYGDDSTTTRDVDTQGRFYVRVDWDKNQALWGNYSTGFTGTEYGQYQRSLYGAAVSWRSLSTNLWGDPNTEIRAFGSQAQSAQGHGEFLGTGGSLYYLRNTNILAGSEVVELEVRNQSTGRLETTVSLTRGADYEIDNTQGRILLTRPLSQITRENLTTLTRDAPLDGYEQRLVVDYEWIPTGLDTDNIAAGLRAKQWFGDHVAVGTTYVDENRAGEDYTLMGGDVTLQAGKGTYLKAEYTQTESSSAPVFYSDNGGLSFTQLNPTGPREGQAVAVEARANFKELGWTEQDLTVGAWWREVGAGYSTSTSYDTGEDVTEYGAEMLGYFTPNLSLYGLYSTTEEGSDTLVQAQLTGQWRIDDFRTLSGEVRRVDESSSATDSVGVLGALKYAQRFGTSLELYGTAQLTLDDDHGQYASNDAYSLGGKYLFGERSSVGTELTSGDRGDAATLEAEYRLNPQQTLYGSYTFSSDVTESDSVFTTNRESGLTLGQRWRLSNQVNLFNESQYLKDPQSDDTGLSHTFGMDFYPAQGWNLGFTLQKSDLITSEGLNVQRKAISLNGGRTSPDTDWQSKLEWRKDSGGEQREQWVATNRLTHKINESWRIAAKLDYSDTDDELDPSAGAKYIESNLGFAWRPWNSTRWGVFGRYTYLYDLASAGQEGGAEVDQRSQVFSLEGVYKYSQHWELAAKLARREGEVRAGRGTGAWFDSATTFASGQIRYELRTQWHALAEYRWLDVLDGGTKQGFLLGLDRDINQYFRIGVGYNFTDFSDDLTDFDYDHKGWFMNIVGSY